MLSHSFTLSDMVLYDLIAENNRSGMPRKGCIWCTDGSFLSPKRFRYSGKYPVGYALYDEFVVSLRKTDIATTKESVISLCKSLVNAGRVGELPSTAILLALRNSIMFGSMKNDLITAGIYRDCNYRNMSDSSFDKNSWTEVWSNDMVGQFTSYTVSYSGSVEKKSIYDSFLYGIPYFDFRK